MSNTKSCRIEGCSGNYRATGLCYKHYARMERTGRLDLADRTPTRQADLKRFFSKFKIGPRTECWTWDGTKVGKYGQFYAQGVRHLAHRYAYETWIGPIPEDHEIDHVYERGCRQTLCVNPFHLEPVTQKENMLRQVNSPSAQNRAKTHCLRGHPLSGDNLRLKRNKTRTYRVCRTCERQLKKERSNA